AVGDVGPERGLPALGLPFTLGLQRAVVDAVGTSPQRTAEARPECPLEYTRLGAREVGDGPDPDRAQTLRGLRPDTRDQRGRAFAHRIEHLPAGEHPEPVRLVEVRGDLCEQL